MVTFDDKLRDEKLQYNINKESAKLPALLPGKTYKHEYLTCKEIPPPDQGRVIEQAKFAYFLLWKVFKKQKIDRRARK